MSEENTISKDLTTKTSEGQSELKQPNTNNAYRRRGLSEGEVLTVLS